MYGPGIHQEDHDGETEKENAGLIGLATITVTRLTADRLRSILERAEELGDSFIALQETRHCAKEVAWVRAIANTYGWTAACSTPPPTISTGAIRQGGTMVLWRKGMGACVKHHVDGPEGHRLVAVCLNQMMIASVYEPNGRDDGWFDDAMGRLSYWMSGACVLLGDCNWNTHYEGRIPIGLEISTTGATTTRGTAPTR